MQIKFELESVFLLTSFFFPLFLSVYSQSNNILVGITHLLTSNKGLGCCHVALDSRLVNLRVTLKLLQYSRGEMLAYDSWEILI